MKTDLLCGIVQKSKTRVECIICGVCIPKAKKCIEQHANGAKHKDTITMMGENGVRFMNEKLHCKLCNQTLDEGESVVKHVESADHATWLEAVIDLVDGEFINLQKYFQNNEEDIVCEACNCPFKFSPGAIEQHVNWFNHRSNLAEKLKPLNALFQVDNDEEVWCKICNAFVSNNTQAILSHIDHDEEHLDWFEDMDEFINEDGINVDGYLSAEHTLTAVCKYCHIEIMCDVFSIENHVKSNLHLSRVVASDET